MLRAATADYRADSDQEKTAKSVKRKPEWKYRLGVSPAVESPKRRHHSRAKPRWLAVPEWMRHVARCNGGLVVQVYDGGAGQ